MVFTGRKQVVSPDQHTLLAFISTFQERMRENRSSRYLTHFTPLRHHLEEYGKTIGHEIDFKHINMDFYHDFLRYLTAKALKKNTIGSVIKRLKRIMSVALKEEITTNRRFQDSEFKGLTEEVDTIYLKENEIQALYKMELKNERAKTICDLFVLNCYTGLRHSDCDKITEQSIKDGNIHLRTQKTNEKVVIPVNAIATAIIEKYKTKGLKVPSLQEVNRVLKWIGEKAELDKVLDPEKCRQLTSHCARRSFASNAYLAGVPTISIMKVTGHRTEKAFMRYIRITALENAILLSKHPFFKK